MTRKKTFIPLPLAVISLVLFGLGGYLGYVLFFKSDRKADLYSAGLQQQESSRACRPVPTAEQAVAPARNPIAQEKAGKQISAPESGRNGVDSRAKRSAGMVWIPGGRFMMGSPEGVGNPNEHPQHLVTVNGFYMDTTEVTQAEYTRVMGVNHSYFKGCPDCPVDSVSWNEANAFCQKTGKRLPTEAEWEYAARAGTTTYYYWGNEMNDAYAWHYGNSDEKTHPVAQKKPNEFGLYDMIGNVWEWCADWYAADYYKERVSDNPDGPDSGLSRIARGGGFWHNREGYILRCAYRNAYTPDYRNVNVGFRCAR